MTRCLITGVGGFIGSYLAEYLEPQGVQVFGTLHRDRRNVAHLHDRIALLECDLLDAAQVRDAVERARPDVIYHLAALSSIPQSWEDPQGVFTINVLGILRLLETVRQVAPSALVLVAGSSTEYGATGPDGAPVVEGAALAPNSPYAVSKAAAGMLALAYGRALGLRCILFRPFQFIGPRKLRDACSSFARGIVAIERGQQDVLRVGNLDAVRDVMDVRDGVRALWLLAQKGAPLATYNVSTGVGHKIGHLLEVMLGMAAVPVTVVRDPALARPGDEPVIIGDSTRLRSLGWHQQYDLETTLRDILEYWRG